MLTWFRDTQQHEGSSWVVHDTPTHTRVGTRTHVGLGNSFNPERKEGGKSHVSSTLPCTLFYIRSLLLRSLGYGGVFLLTY